MVDGVLSYARLSPHPGNRSRDMRVKKGATKARAKEEEEDEDINGFIR